MLNEHVLEYDKPFPPIPYIRYVHAHNMHYRHKLFKNKNVWGGSEGGGGDDWLSKIIMGPKYWGEGGHSVLFALHLIVLCFANQLVYNMET